MKQRELNGYINTITTINPKMALAMPDDIRKQIVEYLVRYRGPIVVELIPPTIDMGWLNSCGYMYETVSEKTGLKFRHTCEHKIG